MGGPSQGAGDELAVPEGHQPRRAPRFDPAALDPVGRGVARTRMPGLRLTGEFGPWAPPPPFAGIGGWQITSLPAAWTRSDILGYIDYCRQRVRDTLEGMTDEKAATPLPPAHRYHGQPHAWILTGAVGHTIEHGSQIRQFITAGGISADTQARPD